MERTNVIEEEMSRIETELKGKTLLVYWYFLHQKDENIGVRAIQRALISVVLVLHLTI